MGGEIDPLTGGDCKLHCARISCTVEFPTGNYVVHLIEL